MAVAPLLAAFARALVTRRAERAARVESLANLPGQLSGHVLIVGYGRVGQSIGRLLDSQQISHVAIDANAGRVARLRSEGVAIYHGDARQFEILARLGVRHATALVVTMDDPATALQTVVCARRDGSTLPIYARVRDEDHATALLDAGATLVIEEAREAALQLGEAVLVGAGMPEPVARDLVAERRATLQAEPPAESESLA
jgi:CPA2 family monovalent cation:H+ antiporter-2